MTRSVAAAVALAALVVAVPLAGARGSSKITGGLMSTGVLTFGSTNVSLSASKGYVMEWAKIPPGASFGWHLHRTPVVVGIAAGTVTVYDGKDTTCTARHFKAGQGFIEPADHVHVMRNDGTTTASIYAVYIGVPGKWRTNPTPLDYYVKAPGNCPASID